MSENSKIEWCHHTFNPWIGCTKVGPGCDNCYAEADFDKRRHVVQWGAGQPRKRTAMSTWAMPLRWNAKAERLGVRYRVFCASLADVFDNEVPAEWRHDLFDLIERTPHLDWLLVTKRIGNVRQMIPDRWSVCMPPNLWLGITVVNQAEADRDIPKLLGLKVSVRFLSMEPLLGPVNLRHLNEDRETNEVDCLHPWTWEQEIDAWRDTDDEWEDQFKDYHGVAVSDASGPMHPSVDWVIVGGESGPKARPMHPQWVRDIRDQCEAAGVPMMLKQWGEWKPISQMDESEHGGLYKSCVIAKPHENQSNLDDIYGRRCTVPSTVLHANGSTHDITEPMAFMQGTEAMQIFRIGKKTAGRLLDGVLHDGYPTPQ